MGQNETYISQFYLKIDGNRAPTEVLNSIIEITVEDNLHLPDMFSIQLHDHNLHWANSELFELGKAVEIAAQAPNPQTKEPGPRTVLIEGEITGLEPELLESGLSTLVVRGYDRAYRLHQGRRTRSFLKSTDSEIVQRLTEEIGLNSDGVRATTTIHEHVIQYNQTNMEFLMERAQKLGYDLYVEGQTLHFEPGHSGNEEAPKLSWGGRLLSFRPCLTVLHQVDEVVVRSWDPLTKREIVARTTETESTPAIQSKERTAKRFKGSNQIVVSRPVQTQAEADALARGIRDEIGGDLIQAEGICLGEPRVAAGKMVEIAGLGDQFDGQYFVTAATHIYSADEAYKTLFTIGGRKPQTLSALLGSNEKAFDPGRGVLVGLVTNNKDPDGLGRIKVKYPTLDDVDESPWIRIAAPMAGEQRGFYCLPEISDEVLVAFEQGDIQRPYMLGMLWNGPDKPPQANSAVVGNDGRVNQRLIRSRSGHEIILDDSAGQEKVIISDSNGNKITMAADSMSIKVAGDLHIEAGGKVSIKGVTIDLN